MWSFTTTESLARYLKPSITFDRVIWAAILISEASSVVSSVIASCNIKQVSFFLLSICFLFPVKKMGKI